MMRRFSVDYDETMEKIQQVAGLETLDSIMEELFAADTLVEAQAILENKGTIFLLPLGKARRDYGFQLLYLTAHDKIKPG